MAILYPPVVLCELDDEGRWELFLVEVSAELTIVQLLQGNTADASEMQ